MSVEVRHIAAPDAPDLRSIRLEALADTPDAFGSTYAEVSAWDEERWRVAAEQWNCFLGFVDGRVAGMASGGFNDDLPGTCWLYGMYVSPPRRGTGLADALVDHVAHWARSLGASELHLAVTESVGRARAFYRRVGFVETGETHVMDRDPSLRLLTMVRRLG